MKQSVNTNLQRAGHLIGLFLLPCLGLMCGATYAQTKPDAGSLQQGIEREAAREPSRKDGYIGGSRAIGRVSDVYLKVGSSVFLTLDRAPETLRKSAERRVDVQFPNLLANGAGTASAFISDSQSSIGVGDIVEIKFAHKNSKEAVPYFPVNEMTRVTELIARRDEMLAKDYAQRIYARTGQGAAGATQLSSSPGTPPTWLPQPAGAPIDPRTGAMPVANQTAASASR